MLRKTKLFLVGLSPAGTGPSTAEGPRMSLQFGRLWRPAGPCCFGPFTTTFAAEMRYTSSITAGSLKVLESQQTKDPC
jgi:hypothetical protein